MKEEQPDYKVSDKRKFDSDGNLREEVTPAEEPAEKNESLHEPVTEPEALGETEAAGAADGATGGGEISFATFVLSLGTQAMVGLGLIPDPYTNKQDVNLEAAKQMIDILVMLREKTHGNLEAAELTLIDNLLYDLQMHYVELSSAKS
jgi:hypothetical protein